MSHDTATMPGERPVAGEPPPSVGPTRRGRGAFRSRLSRWDARFTPYGLVSPFFVIFAVFGLIPLLYTGWLSLHRWDLVQGDHGYVGLGNYTRLLHDPYFWNALSNTLVLFLLSTVPQLFLALGLASLLNRRLRGRSLWRSLVLLPNVMSVTAVTLIFAQIFASQTGLANGLLGLIGLDAVNWQANHWSAMIAISVIAMWRWTGYSTLIFLAALQNVPKELTEAAALDGASRTRTFWSVVVPNIRPTILFVVVTSTIGGLHLFAEPALFDTQGVAGTGGSDRQFQTLMMYLYERGFRDFNAGYAATIAWVIFAVIALVSFLNFTLARRIASKG